MKKVSISFFLACSAVFSVNAAVAIDTNVTYISPNVVAAGSWSLSTLNSVIDTTGGLMQLDSTGATVVNLHTVKQPAFPDTTDTSGQTLIYPYTSLSCEFGTDTNFVGATALRITYKAVKAWAVSLTDTTLDQDNAGPYEKSISASASWSTKYLNLLDVNTLTGFNQPPWMDSTYLTPINYHHIQGIEFDPYDPNDLGITASITIRDIRIYHYGGFSNPVKFSVSKSVRSSGGMNMTMSNTLKFSVPQNSTYSISIFSPEGKLAAGMSKSCSSGRNEIALKNCNLSPGLYLVKISKADFSAMGKILIK